MRIRTLETFPDELDAIAKESPDATFYHSAAWIRSVAAVYSRFSFRCLLAEEGTAVVGLLPFFFIKKGPFRSAWSMPFGSYGGPIAQGPDVRGELLRAYGRTLSRGNMIEAGWVDFRNAGPAPGPGWSTETCQTHLIDLRSGFEVLWAGAIDRQRRKRCRQAERAGVSVRRGDSPEDLRSYYEIYSRRLAAWGRSDRYPFRLFEELLRRGGQSVRLYAAIHEGRVVGGHVNFYFGSTVTAWNGMTSPEADEVQAATMLYAHCIREACGEGYAVYNLGASLGKQSLIEFKESLSGVPYRYQQYRRRSLVGAMAATVKRIGR